jgi:hypothetical protein
MEENKMKWNKIEEVGYPDTMREVIVSDGYGSYAVAFYGKRLKKWYPSTDLLDSNDYIKMDQDIIKWAEIENNA